MYDKVIRGGIQATCIPDHDHFPDMSAIQLDSMALLMRESSRRTCSSTEHT